MPPQVENEEEYSKVPNLMLQKFDVFSAGILFFEIQQFGLKFNQIFIDQFENEKYPKIDTDDFDDFPWMIDCLKPAEKDRLSALEVFINLSESFFSSEIILTLNQMSKTKATNPFEPATMHKLILLD